MKPVLILLLLICFRPHVVAQNDCNIRFDNKRIATNANLGYFVTRLGDDSFTIGYDKHLIPGFAKGTIKCLLGTLANPGEDWQSGCTSQQELPERRLLFFAVNRLKDMFVIVYSTGGIGVCEHVILMDLKNKEIKPGKLMAVKDIWIGHGFFRRREHSIPELIRFINSNKNKGNEGEVYY